MSNIILIGYRGSGKTRTADALAEKLGMRVIRTDEEIEKKSGKIKDFVEKNGWEKFRDLEEKTLQKLSAKNSVVDCGGGVVEREKNVDRLKKMGKVVWLKAGPKQIVQRIKESMNRPSLTGKNFLEEVEEVLERRTPLYQKASALEVDTDGKTAEEVAGEIIRKLGSRMCVSITARTKEETLQQLGKTETDLIELRADYLEGLNSEIVKEIVDSTSKEIIVTCRDKDSKGKFRGSSGEKLEILKVIAGKAFCIDVEQDFGRKEEILENRKNSKIIVSHHDFEKTPSLKELESKYHEIKKSNPDIIKIVATATSINDNFKIFNLLEGKTDLAAFCMGRKGEISRVLAKKYGSKLAFAALKKGKESAPGQITEKELNETYNFNLVNDKTSVVGLIGSHAENSWSKYMANQFFKKNKLNYIYVPFKTETHELEEFIQNFRKHSFLGAAVTIPHKQEVMKLVDELDETAERIGAVNTITNAKGKLKGYNTDWHGAMEALREKLTLEGKKVLVIGAGGAAMALTYGLKKEGAEVTITNRTLEKAKSLAEEFNASYKEFENIKEAAEGNEVIINTTSLGMTPNGETTPLKKVPPRKVVMDIVYTPRKTQLIKNAEKTGCTTVTGEKMLLHQAVEQFRLFTGIKPKVGEMEKSLRPLMEE